ncbi:MAG: hypothetical protein V1876_02645, partial [Candidatus Peregrinibacteria bacterium]
PARPDVSARPEEIEPFISSLLGKTEPQAKMLGTNWLNDFCNVSMGTADDDKRLAFAEWMANAIASKQSDYRGHPRFQRFLDEAAAILLAQTAEKISAIPKATLTADARSRQTFERTLLALYKMTAESKDSALADDASRLLEYVLYGGTAGKYQAYVDYLKHLGLVPPRTLTTGGWRMRSLGTWFSPYITDCEMRLSQGATMSELTVLALNNSTIIPHRDAAKGAPW